MPAFSKKYFIILVASLPCLFSGCNKKHSEKQLQTFYLNYSGGTIESIDPAFAKNLYNMWTDHMIYNTLVETNEQLLLVPSLAKSWDVSDDGLKYIFHLRNDVYFHDDPVFTNGKGRKLTALDVVYSFGRLIDPATASSGAWIFNDRVAEKDPFVAIDDSTVQINLKNAFRPLPQILTMPYCSIVPHESVERWGKDFNQHPCGTGPFKFQHWDEGNVLVLKKNLHYWETDAEGIRLPYIDAVQITFVDSKATEFFLFLQGKVDFVNSIDGSFKDLILSKDGMVKKEYSKKFQLTKGSYLNTEYIGFLTDTAQPAMATAPTKNKLVRRAINYAIDRKKIATYFRNGAVLPALAGFIPDGIPGHDSSNRIGYSFDPEKALALLAEAGHPGGKGLSPLVILAPDNWADVVNFIATELQDIGINVQVEIIQANILRQQMSKGDAVAFRAQWIADYPDAETFLAVFNSRFPAPPNYTRFKNKEFDRLYDESMNAPDTLRWKIYRKMDSIASSEAPLIPIFYDERLHFTQNNISGFKSNPMNIIELKYVVKK
jgi:oligopeptide transport system substrate-binding protein